MRHGAALMTSALFFAATCLAQAQDVAKNNPVDPSKLATFIKAHKGPVLDVRMENDCSDGLSLKQTTARIGFDFGPDDAEGKTLAQSAFLDKVKANKTLAAAVKSKSTALVVCCAGGRSEAAAQVLASNGCKVAHVPGGLQNAKFPMP